MRLAAELRHVFARTLRASRSGHRFVRPVPGPRGCRGSGYQRGTVNSRTVEETVPARLLNTSALQHLFRQSPGGVPHCSGPPPVIMLLIVRFSTGRIPDGLRLVPQPRRAVAAGGGEQAPVRAERHPADRAGRGRSGCAGARRWPGPTAAPCRRCWRWRAARPSGLNATPRTAPAWPVRVRRCSPVAGSHSRAVSSLLAVASRRPSGLNATPSTVLVVAGQGAQLLAGGRVPQPRRLVAAGGGEQAPVRAERHPVESAVVAGQGAQVLAGGRVPQPRRLVGAGGGEQPPVRAERHPDDRVGVAGQGAQVLAGGRVPQPRRACRGWRWRAGARPG